MPRIETEVRLDFKDVLIRPKRSTLKSRSQVDVHREFHFRNSKRTWTGVVRHDLFFARILNGFTISWARFVIHRN